MAQATHKKTSASKKKTSAAKKNAHRKNRTRSAGDTLYSIISKKELQSTLIFVLGLLLLIVALFRGGEGSFWRGMHNLYFALLGMVGFFLPLMILFFGVINVLNKQKPVYRTKALQLFLLIVIICALFHINTFARLHEEDGFFRSIGILMESAADGTVSPIGSGGLIGALTGGLLFHLCKKTLIANILAVLLLVTDLMFLFNITLFHLFSRMEAPVQKVGQYTGDAIENMKADFENRKRENAQKKENKRQQDAGFEPSRILDDYLSGSGAEKKSSVVTAEDDRDIATIFSDAGPRFAGKNSENETASVNAENQPAASVYEKLKREQKQTPVVPFGADAFPDADMPGEEKPVQVKPEKAAPLSEKESNEIKSELQDGLTVAPKIEYVKPPLACLNMPQRNNNNYDVDELKANGDKLIAALNSFNVSATIVDVVPGPTVTRYELSPAPGVKISKFVGLSDDLALHMAAPAGLRIEAPIPNKAAIGIEIPNRNKATVSFREIIDNDTFRNARSKLNVALGKDISGDVIFCDLAKMPHLLVAGTTGSGKSVCMNTMIVSLLYNASPDEVRILLIDPKQVEFMPYNGLPHLLVPVVSDPRKASGALGWAVTEMLSRYKTLNANGVRDFAAYNSLCETREDLQKMPQIVIFIDELADLMTVAPAEVEDSIQRLAQMARAAGMHLVIATQRPSVDVITGVIKANIPSRIALMVKSQVDSRTMIDQAGAEKLMGYGDMLYYPVGAPKPIRLQGAFLKDSEIENVVSFIKSNGTASYDDAVQQEIERQAASEKKKGGGEEKSSGSLDKNDDLLMRAIELFVGTPEKASISALQRHLGLGFAKAGRLMDTLEEQGVVGPAEGSKPRKVLITKAQWYEMNAMNSDVSDARPGGDSVESFPMEGDSV